MKKLSFLLFAALLTGQQTLFSQQTTWPKEIPIGKSGGKVIIYQPQPDALEGITLTGRAAIAGKEKASDELVFGAIFFEAKLSTDKATRKAGLESIKITNAKVKGLEDEEKIKKLLALIESEVPKWNIEMSLDQLASSIKKAHPDAEIYNNTPPKIIYRDKPTSLIVIDGEPKIQKDKDLDAEKVVNSPNLIFKEGSQWNMYEGGTWYKSAAVTSGWTAEKTMSKKVKSINDQIKKQEKENNDNKEPAAKPEVTDILVSTEPAEVIQTKGAPVYKKIDSTSLSYVSNSTNDILKDANGQIYILIAGRWYRSASLNGPWTFNEPDKLPADFSKIPEGSEKDAVLVSVSGTDAAEEAIIDAEIPQTAKVDRKTATVDVKFDGEPKFESIEGCTLQLAANANLTILKEASGNYFALDNGVWFVSSTAKGPWKVAENRPADLERIPAKSAAYNAKFVHIYESTADYVVVGYTAGYLGSYIQGDPVIVFGTGFHYQPWLGSVYYPRPTTWGFGFNYNPWTGWSMGLGFNIGFLHVGIGFGGSPHGGGWFGPPMYRPPYYRPPYHGGGGYYGGSRPGYGGGNHYGNNNITINNNHNNIYRPNNRPGNSGSRPGVFGNNRPTNNRPGSNYRPGNNNFGGNNNLNNNNRPNRTGNNNNNLGNNNNRPGNNNNSLGNNNNRPGNNNNRPDNNVGNGGNRNGFDGNNRNATPSKQPNNVFADRDGNVFQKDKQGNINQRDNKTNTWNKPSSPSNNNTVNRDVNSRDRGNQRTNNFNNASAPSFNRSQPARPAAGNAGQAGGARGKRR